MMSKNQDSSEQQNLKDILLTDQLKSLLNFVFQETEPKECSEMQKGILAKIIINLKLDS